MSWGDICQWVLGRPSPLWPLMFEQPLLERAKQLVSRDFSAVVDEVADLLGTALQASDVFFRAAPRPRVFQQFTCLMLPSHCFPSNGCLPAGGSQSAPLSSRHLPGSQLV